MQTMQEGHPEIAQLFLEAAGAETIHGISHLQVAGGITTPLAHLDEAANGEDDEIEAILILIALANQTAVVDVVLPLGKYSPLL